MYAAAALDFHFDRRQTDPLLLSVVIPTLNERDNVLRLFERLASALAGLEWEAIFVDDGSTDGTAEAITRLGRADRRARLIRRLDRRGLASAVIEGMMSSIAPVVAVIDADLQHDERLLPQLVSAIDVGGCDLAIGSRYTAGGSVGNFSSARLRISRVATRLADLVTKVTLADPMSGFFAISREKMLEAAPHLSGAGYKILLDIVASSPEPLRIKEMPYRFRERDAGESKLDTAVTLAYLQLLAEKTIGRWVSVRFLKFATVGVFGVLVHLAALGAALHLAGLPFAVAMPVATAVAMTSNFHLNNIFTYRDRRLRGFQALVGLGKFYAICSFGAAANVFIGDLVVHSEPWWVAGAAGAAAGAVWNYAMGSVFAWSGRR